jgi:hypothetical protein
LKKIYSCIMLLSIILLSGCGQEHEIKTIVKDFMKDNMTLDDHKVIEWSKVGDTYFVSDSIIQVMHTHAEQDKLVKPNTSYMPRTEKLYFIQVKYAVSQDTIKQTFYLDDQMSGVVCFKKD